MENLPINPVFNDKLRKLQTTDKNHADTFNPNFEQLLNNDLFLKKEIENARLDVDGVTTHVNVKKFGAKGDGVNDDTSALISARDYAIANNGVLFIPPNFNCFIPNGIDLFGVRNIRFEGRITGSGVENEIIIGIRSGITIPFKANISRVEKLKVKVQGVKNGEIFINFAPHLLLWADGAIADIASLSYSSLYLGKIDHVEINSRGENSWINENKFFGGRITRLTIDGGYKHNHNIFYSPTLENSTVTINTGSSNKIMGARFEGTNTVTFGAEAWDNEILRSWHSAPGSFLRGHSRTPFVDNGKNNNVFNASDSFFELTRVFSIFNDSMNYNVNYVVRNADGTFDIPTAGLYKNVFETELIEITTDIGLEFLSDNSLWRLFIETYDVNRVKISTDTTGFLTSGEMSWDTTNGRYRTTIDRGEVKAALFKNTAVKYVKIYAIPNKKGNFKSLKLDIRHNKNVPIYASVLEKHTRKTAIDLPNAGVFNVGDIVWSVGNDASVFIKRLTDGTTHVLDTDWKVF